MLKYISRDAEGPVRELPIGTFWGEVVRRKTTRIGGCDLASILRDECTLYFLPSTFEELDALTLIRYQHPDLMERLNRTDFEFDSGDWPHGINADLFRRMRDAVRSLSLILPSGDIEAMLAYDPRTRFVCTIATLLHFTFILVLLHFGNASYNIVYRCFVFLAYSVPICYWQWMCTVRVAIKLGTANRGFHRGFKVLEMAEELAERPYLVSFDYEKMLSYFLSLCKETVDRSPDRVDQFLRSPNMRTGKDRFAQFYLWWAIAKRREEPSAQRREAMHTFIINVFFQQHSHLFVEFEGPLLNIILSSKKARDDPFFYDQAWIALVNDLEMRLDMSVILDKMKAEDERKRQQSAASAAAPAEEV